MLKKGEHIFCLAQIYIENGKYTDTYYKLYDKKTNKVSVLSLRELTKLEDSIYNVYNKDPKINCLSVSLIAGIHEEYFVIESLKKNKKPSTDPYSTYTRREKEEAKKYTIIDKGEDYVIGMNLRGRKKEFSLSDILSMSKTELVELFNIDNSKVRKYLENLESNGKYKYKNTNIEKENTSRLVMGSDFNVRYNGDIVINNNISNTSNVNIILRKLDSESIKVVSNGINIQNVTTFKIMTGPKKLVDIQKLGSNRSNVNIVLPNTLEKIESRAMTDCGMRELDLKRCKNLKHIGTKAFSNSNLKGLEFPDSVYFIGQFVLQDCYDLEWVIFPANIGYFDPSWILGCKNLKKLVLPYGEMEYWKSNKGTELAQCDSLTEIYTSQENVRMALEIKQEVERLRKFISKRVARGKQFNNLKVIVVRRKEN